MAIVQTCFETGVLLILSSAWVSRFSLMWKNENTYLICTIYHRVINSSIQI